MAALTITSVTDVNPQYPAVQVGGVKAKLVTLVFDDGLDAGGAAFVPSDVGFTEFLLVLPFTDAGDNGTVVGAGWVPQYNYVDETLMIFGGAASTDNLAESDESVEDVQVRALVLGI